MMRVRERESERMGELISLFTPTNSSISHALFFSQPCFGGILFVEANLYMYRKPYSYRILDDLIHGPDLVPIDWNPETGYPTKLPPKYYPRPTYGKFSKKKQLN